MMDLEEELTCSICLDLLKNPITLECSHNFCSTCITAQWTTVKQDTPGSAQLRCPECWRPCQWDRCVRDTRLQSLLRKLTSHQDLEMLSQKDDLEKEPRALQLVKCCPSEGPELDISSLNYCLRNPKVANTHVCLITILGEQRTGKSFLLNQILLALEAMESGQGNWRPQGREYRQGFQWGGGSDTITKGVWIWSHPFLLDTNAGKVAVFLLDTEGTMAPGQNKETSVKLSALSMLFSSYQILNVSRQLKETDLEYLEMFLRAAETIGNCYEMEVVQHLDLLVRDCFFATEFGWKPGKAHMTDVIHKQFDSYPNIQEMMQRGRTHCYLLPFPGKKMVTKAGGNTADMDDEFRRHLKAYIGDVLLSVTSQAKSHQKGLFTGSQLADAFEELSNLMRHEEFGFSSPVEISIRFQARKLKKDKRKEFEEFLLEQNQATKRLFSALPVTPRAMRARIDKKRDDILHAFSDAYKGHDQSKSTETFRKELQDKEETFLKAYLKRFCGHAAAVGAIAGAGLLTVVGGAVGVGVASAVAAAEAAELAIAGAAGAGAGIGVGAGLGAGVGAGVGARMGRRNEKAEWESEEDEEPLFQDER
ncbi:RING finger protein 112-like [Tachyglossus aculeatus]|uniref:RING finger protein 112-like n=1 Tax=Tachyglossus aculeatus TaxID=9261 RepID=UPI0018F3CB15|nr:RING finger protein 112-like [Tachyglossus aculeatus]